MQQQALLVDELAPGTPDTALASNPNVIFYPSNNALNEIIFPGGIWAMLQFGDASWYGCVAGWHGSGGPAIVAAPEYGVNYLRHGSPFTPNNVPCSFVNPVTWGTPGSCSSGFPIYETICNHRAYLNHNTREFSGFVGIGNVPIRALYVRYAVVIEEDVEFAFNETGMKLGGIEPMSNGQGCRGTNIFWYAPPSGGQTELCMYNDSASFGEEHGTVGGQFPSHPIVDLGDVLNLEVLMVQNTDHNTSDGIMGMWLNNTNLIWREGMKWHDTPPSNGVVEVNHIHNQIYHGGNGNAPTAEMHHRTMGWCAAYRAGQPAGSPLIGAMRTI